MWDVDIAHVRILHIPKDVFILLFLATKCIKALSGSICSVMASWPSFVWWVAKEPFEKIGHLHKDFLVNPL